MIKKYYDTDCNLSVLDGKTVAVIGFGSQGHAHSMNLAESGVKVVVGLRKGSAHWEKAEKFAETNENFSVATIEEAAQAGDVVMMLVPDELAADIYNKQAVSGANTAALTTLKCSPESGKRSPMRKSKTPSPASDSIRQTSVPFGNIPSV